MNRYDVLIDDILTEKLNFRLASCSSPITFFKILADYPTIQDMNKLIKQDELALKRLTLFAEFLLRKKKIRDGFSFPDYILSTVLFALRDIHTKEIYKLLKEISESKLVAFFWSPMVAKNVLDERKIKTEYSLHELESTEELRHITDFAILSAEQVYFDYDKNYGRDLTYVQA